MRNTPPIGSVHVLTFVVTQNKTVPHLYPESQEFTIMPSVFATGYLVGLFEWACIEHLSPYLDDGESSLGTHIDVSHEAATPPGFRVKVTVTCVEVNGRRITWDVVGHDGHDVIGRGRITRTVISLARFASKMAEKRARNSETGIGGAEPATLAGNQA